MHDSSSSFLLLVLRVVFFHSMSNSCARLIALSVRRLNVKFVCSGARCQIHVRVVVAVVAIWPQHVNREFTVMCYWNAVDLSTQSCILCSLGLCKTWFAMASCNTTARDFAVSNFPWALRYTSRRNCSCKHLCTKHVALSSLWVSWWYGHAFHGCLLASNCDFDRSICGCQHGLY